MHFLFLFKEKIDMVRQVKPWDDRKMLCRILISIFHAAEENTDSLTDYTDRLIVWD